MNVPSRRVVVTGIGVIAPNGFTVDEFWESLINGKSAGKKLTRFKPDDDNRNHFAAEINNFSSTPFISDKRSRRLDLSTKYGIVASFNAVNNASLNINNIDPDRIGIIEGISMGGLETTTKGQTAILTGNNREINLFTIINGYTGAGSGEIALELGIRGLALTYCSSSASGSDAIGYAFNLIQQDDADVMIAGGNEAPLFPGIWKAFCMTKAMSSCKDTPQSCMKPYDIERDGFLLGEGAAYLVLEELSYALSRNAPIYAELLSHGRSCDSYHSVEPHPEGIGLVKSLKKALKRANLNPSDVDYINSHGTATKSNDVVETKAIINVFGDHAKQLAVSSTKPVTGHLLGAAGAIEAAICVLSIKNNEIPPTINLKTPEPLLDLDYVQGKSRKQLVNHALNINTGFGGKNSCLIFGKYKSKW